MSYSVIRSHEICAGHRVVGHESKCRHLHGHNYVFRFKVQPKRETKLEYKGATVTKGAVTTPLLEEVPVSLDSLGRVIDFSVVKSTLCQWLEDNWDHKFLHWEKDPLIAALTVVGDAEGQWGHFDASLVPLPFNPTAENLAAHMVNVVGPMLLDEHGVGLVSCTIEETSKCHVEYTK
jgi:6-pyruvoyltetrahydropterin/6-carboxytetrahydropterin synthase